ncbi:type II toxin-antitoxin system MqsR family toxin [Caldicellulosiruptoraceae bacterium PP1]
MKKLISVGKFRFVNRDKNIRFMREHGLLIEDIKEILLQLEPKDYIKGPEKDYNEKYKGDIWVFKNNSYLEVTIYIKIRHDPPNEVVCISFHEDEE